MFGRVLNSWGGWVGRRRGRGLENPGMRKMKSSDERVDKAGVGIRWVARRRHSRCKRERWWWW